MMKFQLILQYIYIYIWLIKFHCGTGSYIYTADILILSDLLFFVSVHLTIMSYSDWILCAVMPQRVCYHNGR